jgi:hypothetical protein
MTALDPARCAHMTWIVGEGGVRMNVAVAAIAPLPSAWLPFFRGNPADVLDLAARGEPGKGFWPLVETADAYNEAIERLQDPVRTIDTNALEVRDHQAKEFKPLAVLKALKKLAAGVQLANRIAAGHAHNGHTYQIDELSQGRIAAIAASAVASQINGGPPWTTIGWRTAANAKVDYATAAGFLVFAHAMKTRVQALRAKYWDLVDAIEAAGNAAAVIAIDVNAGWPA